MKKIIFVLAAALIVGMGSLSAQNKFKAAAAKAGTTKTEKVEKPAAKAEKPAAKAEKPAAKAEKPATKAEKPAAKAEKPDAKTTTTKSTEAHATKSATASKAKLQTLSKAKATPKAAKAAKVATASRAVDHGMFNGTWANSYSDGIGGMVTDYLNLTFDSSTGMAKGEYKDENGNGRKVSGKLVGNKLVMTYDADGDEFATISIINENTLKLEGFTGTFKRVENMEAAPKVDIATPVEEAPVDPAFNEVKEYLKNK